MPWRRIVPALRDIQSDFRATVLGGVDVVAPHVRAARGPVARRIAVYRNTVQASLSDVLAVAFPVAKRIVGDAFFFELARRFIVAHPPRLPQLSAYGGDFAAFIGRDDRLAPLPYLADVARLEWARGEAYFAADGALLRPEDLTAVPTDRLSEIRLTMHPAARLIRSVFPVHRIWSVNQPEIQDVPPVDMTRAESVLVSRPLHHVITRGIAPADGALIVALAEGATLADAVEAAVAVDHAFDLKASLAQHLLNGTFAAVIPPPSASPL
jgi:hypothetical protein